jgi:hypothetical protein
MSMIAVLKKWYSVVFYISLGLTFVEFFMWWKPFFGVLLHQLLGVFSIFVCKKAALAASPPVVDQAVIKNTAVIFGLLNFLTVILFAFVTRLVIPAFFG